MDIFIEIKTGVNRLFLVKTPHTMNRLHIEKLTKTCIGTPTKIHACIVNNLRVIATLIKFNNLWVRNIEFVVHKYNNTSYLLI